MKNFEELSSLWIAQPEVEQVAAETLLKQVKKGVNAMNRKLLYSVLMMAATFIFMIILFLFFLFNSWLTYAGIVIVMSTVLIYGLMMYRDYRLIIAHDPTTEITRYLENLKIYKTSRTRMYGKMYYVYTAMLTIGLGLYMVEVLKPSTLLFKITSVTLTLGWVLFVTFYWRKRIIQTENETINDIIYRLERLQNQFKD